MRQQKKEVEKSHMEMGKMEMSFCTLYLVVDLFFYPLAKPFGNDGSNSHTI